MERIPELADAARGNLAATGHGGGRGAARRRLARRAADRAPFDAIAVAAAAAELPQALLDQLAPGGRLVLPLGRQLVRVTDEDGGWSLEPLAPVRFVPLVTGSAPLTAGASPARR